MQIHSDRLTPFHHGRDGVALPVALLALVATALLITTVILSSATEVTLSGAHQDATRDLYTAEGAIEAYVAQTNFQLGPRSSFTYTPPDGSVNDQVQMEVKLLAEGANPTPAFPADSTFSITATRIRGGRQVTALITLANRPMNMNVNGAVVVGNDVNFKGATTISDGSDSQICDDFAGSTAIQTTSDADVTKSNNTTIIGSQTEAPVSRDRIVENMFGTTLKELIAKADIKFGPKAFGSTQVSSSGSRADPANPQATPYNWGCPADVYLDSKGVTQCEADSDKTYYPLVAIDASNLDGSWGSVTVNLSHAQGMLVVYNGNLDIQGNLQFKGAILVEGNFKVAASGGGANTPKIEGAIIGLGYGQNGLQSEIDHTTTGAPTIRYNRCALKELQSSWQTTRPVRTFEQGTFGWVEVVR
jgi:hypothetical protein